jgi:hypothetical protein
MQIALENRKKVVAKSLKNALKNKTKVLKGGASSSGVKRVYDTRFLEDEEHLHFDGDTYEDWMETIGSPQHFQHLQHHLQ